MLPSYSYRYVYLIFDFSGCKFDVLAQMVRAPRRKPEGVSGSSPLCITLWKSYSKFKKSIYGIEIFKTSAFYMIII